MYNMGRRTLNVGYRITGVDGFTPRISDNVDNVNFIPNVSYGMVSKYGSNIKPKTNIIKLILKRVIEVLKK